MISLDVHNKVYLGSTRPEKLHIMKKKGISCAQKTQCLEFQIMFSFWAITYVFSVRFSISAPVLNSELRCGSNGIFHEEFGGETGELYRKLSDVTSYLTVTV